MERGVLITFEGIEGSGKTTQVAMLADRLSAEGRRVMVTHEPGGTPVGEAIRKIFLDPLASLEPAAELLLVLADRAQHVRETLRPALEAGGIVISDRYSDSTLAYQGYGRGFDLGLLRELNRLVSDGIVPDLTILLDCPVETGLERTRGRMKGRTHQVDRFESEGVEFHSKVRDGFRTIARAEPGRVVLVDSTRAPEAVAAESLNAVRRLLEVRCL